MSLADRGMVCGTLSNETVGWTQDNKAYPFPPMERNGLRFTAVKRKDNRLEIVVHGPFQKSYQLIGELPPSEEVRVRVTWGGPEGDSVRLHLNETLVATVSRESSGVLTQGEMWPDDASAEVKTFLMAAAFEQSSMILCREWLLNSHQIQLAPAMTLPPIILEAFATELYVKCLLALDNVKIPWKHDLRLLFDKLATSTQLRVRALYDILNQQETAVPGLQRDFDAELDKSSKSFENLRYIHSTDDPSTWAGSQIRRALGAAANERLNPPSAEIPPTSPPH